jgi:uncharacterized protein RhaS with RHS repeats
MHARFYSASAGRFLSVDPGRFNPKRPQLWNRYAYVGNNPVSNVDPDGRECPPCVEETINAVGTAAAMSSPLPYMSAYNEAVMETLFPSPRAPNGLIQPTYAEFAIVGPFVPSAASGSASVLFDGAAKRRGPHSD